MRIIIYRHPECARCARITAALRWLNWLNRAEFSTTVPPTGPLRMGEVVVEEIASRRVHHGYAAFRLIAHAIPAYLPLRILCIFPPMRRHFARQLSAGALEA